MSDADRALCRKAAAECIELARTTSDIELKEKLLARSQEWLKLAYSQTDTEFMQLLDQFNIDQLAPANPSTVHRQPMQQQQTKAEDDE